MVLHSPLNPPNLSLEDPLMPLFSAQPWGPFSAQWPLHTFLDSAMMTSGEGVEDISPPSVEPYLPLNNPYG